MNPLKTNTQLGYTVVICLILIVLPVWGHWVLQSHQHLSGDMSELIPKPDGTAEINEARARVQSHFTEVLLVSIATNPTAEQRKALRNYLEQWNTGESVSKIWIQGDPLYDATFAEEAKQWIWPLFFSRWVAERLEELEPHPTPDTLAESLAQIAVLRLEVFLDDPAASGAADWIPYDPLLLLPETLELMSAYGESNRVDPGSNNLFIWIPVEGNPFSREGQTRLTAISEELYEGLSALFPGTAIAVEGIHRPAIESESMIRAEVVRLNLGAGLLVLLLLAFVFRNPLRIGVILIPVVAGALWGMLATLFVFGQIHILALGISSVIVGVGIDYSLHLLTRAAETNTSLKITFKEIRRPLLIGAGSSMLGFSFLHLSPIAAIQQVGILLPVGIGIALLTCWLVIPGLLKTGGALPPLLRRTASLEFPEHWRNIIRVVLVLAAVISLLSLIHPQFDDAIDSFQLPPGKQTQSYETLRSAFTGEVPEGALWMTYASSGKALFSRLDAVAKSGNHPLLAELIHPPTRTPAMNQLKADGPAFSAALKRELEAQSFDTSVFSGALATIDNLKLWLGDEQFERALGVLANSLYGPTGVLLLEDKGHLVTVYPVDSAQGKTPPEGTLRLGERERIDAALKKARTTISTWLMVGFGCLAIVLGLLLGIRRGIILCTLPLIAVSIPFAILSLTGGISILGLFGAILGFCLALDYAAFGSEGRGGPILSVRLSGLTTALAFGVLSLSSIPALSQLGLMVSLSVAIAVIATEVFSPQSPQQT